MNRKLGLNDLDVKGRRVLMRVDFNVPQDDAGHITDDKRIRAALPSIQAVLKKGGSLVLMSHLGRPKGKPDPKFSLAPCAARLSELLKKPVRLLPDCIGPAVAAGLRSAQARRGGPAREPPLPRGGAGRRRRVRQTDRRARRPLRQRRLRHLPPARRLHGRRPAGDGPGRRGLPGREGNRVPLPRAGIARASVLGDPRRRQGLRQDHRHREVPRQRGRRPHRRRDGLRLPQGQRQERGQVQAREDRRRGPGRRGAAGARRRREEENPDPAAGGPRRRAASSRPTPRSRSSRTKSPTA